MIITPDEAKHILKNGLTKLDRMEAWRYFLAHKQYGFDEVEPIDAIFDLIENNTDTSYKIKLMKRDTIRIKPNDWQMNKKIYDSYKKFMRYGKDMFNRYHNVKHYNGNDTYCILYKMVNGKWIEIEPPKEFLNLKD